LALPPPILATLAEIELRCAELAIASELPPAWNPSERLVTKAYEAPRFVEAHHREPVTSAALLRLHRLFTRGTDLPPRVVGALQTAREPRVRILHVWTSRRDNKLHARVAYTPPPAELLPSYMKTLVSFANGEGEAGRMHPVLRAALVRFFVVWLTPFYDANARVGQALVAWVLLRAGYGIVRYASIAKATQRYRNRMDDVILGAAAKGDVGNLTEWVALYLKLILLALDALDDASR
jgi:Fic family protein